LPNRIPVSLSASKARAKFALNRAAAQPQCHRRFIICCATETCFVGNTSRTLTGYAAGGGFAYAISPNVSLFAEYLYFNLGHGGNVNSVAISSGNGSIPSSFTAHFSNVIFNVVRIGLNYKF
jgi:opacity protein-like surface antigen